MLKGILNNYLYSDKSCTSSSMDGLLTLRVNRYLALSGLQVGDLERNIEVVSQLDQTTLNRLNDYLFEFTEAFSAVRISRKQMIENENFRVERVHPDVIQLHCKVMPLLTNGVAFWDTIGILLGSDTKSVALTKFQFIMILMGCLFDKFNDDFVSISLEDQVKPPEGHDHPTLYIHLKGHNQSDKSSKPFFKDKTYLRRAYD